MMTKTKFIIIVVAVCMLLMTHRPLYAAGVVTTCDEASLVTALAGGGVVDFNIGTDCEIIFTSEKIISVNTTIQNTSDYPVIFSGGNTVGLFTVNNGASLTLNNLNLQNAKSPQGGAIFNDESTLNVINSIFLNNEVDGVIPPPSGGYSLPTDPNISGGAIFSFGVSVTNVTGSIFINNTAYLGGAISVEPEWFATPSSIAYVTISDSVFQDNTASDGGAIHIADAETELTGNLFENNHGGQTGAVIYTVNSGTNQINVSNNTFLNHRDYTYTTLFISMNSGTELNFSVRNNNFINNTSLIAPCGVLTLQDVLSPGDANGDVTNNTFSGNVFSSNSATVCAGDDSNQIVHFTHNTFSDNTNHLIVFGFGDFILSANIFQNGGCLVDLGGAYTDGGNNITYNATGCVGANVDPQLSPIFSYAFVPSPTSPALDAYSAPCLVSDDQFGTSRPQNGACDIGAIEGSASPNTTITTCSESALNLALAGGGTVDFNIGADCTIPFTFEKIIGTNTTVQNTSAFDVIFDGGNDVGLFTVNNGATLTLDNLTLQNAYSLQGGAVFNDESALHVIDSVFDNNHTYTSWSLFDVYFDGISDGGAGGAILSRGVSLTTITGSTFTHNRALYGGAVSAQSVSSSQLTVSDSIFSDNWALTGGAILASHAVTITDSIFDNNLSDWEGIVVYTMGMGMTGGQITILDSAFINHIGEYHYGVLVILGGSDSSLEFSVQRNHFINNTSTIDFCSAIRFDNIGVSQFIGDLTNNTFSGNNSITGGGTVCIIGDNSIVDIIHNTFVGNNTPNGNNLRLINNGTYTAIANIFQDGGCLFESGASLTDGGNNIAYNAMGCVGANANLQLGALVGGAYHIPANNAIEYAPACEVATDQLGVSRPFGALCTPGAIEIEGGPAQVVTVEFSAPSGFSGEEFSNIGDILHVTTDDNQPTNFTATVILSVTGGSATSADYNLTGTLTIPAGTPHNSLLALSGAITVIDDAIDESNETLELLLSAPNGAVLGAQTTYTYTIIDNDTAGYGVNTSATTAISEPNGTTSFTIVLNSQPTGNVVLNFGTTDNTECVPNPVTFTFTNLNWNNAQTISIVAQDDAVVDGTQACEITISRDGASAASEYSSISNPANVAVMVQDDDVPIVERDLILTENGLLTILSAQAIPDTVFVISDITPTAITIVMGYAGEYGQVIINVNDADLTRFTIASITAIGGGAVSSTYSNFVYQQLLDAMLSAIDEWIIAQVTPATAEIKQITISDVMMIRVDVSN